jgi:hypothetical protein
MFGGGGKYLLTKNYFLINNKFATIREKMAYTSQENHFPELVFPFPLHHLSPNNNITSPLRPP